MQEYQGKVKWYDPDKAYGFLTGGPLGDIFVHRSQLNAERDELIEGQEVLFRARDGQRGPEAYDVRVIAESHLPPRTRRGERREGESRTTAHRRRRDGEPVATLPRGAVTAKVVSEDRDGRFVFVHAERDGFDIFVHGSLVRQLSQPLRKGDLVRVTVEQGPKGLRAVTLEKA